MIASVPPDESERLVALKKYRILNTLPEEAFNEVAHMAAFICECPIATISFIEEDRQWYKAKIGMDLEETPREMAFCAHTILQNEMLVVRDATEDSRFSDNPVVTGEPHVRFYAGLPLVNPAGHALGTLCVVDTQPRELSFDQVWVLESLRKHLVAHLELRLKAFELEEAAMEIGRLREVVDEFQSWTKNRWSAVATNLRKFYEATPEERESFVDCPDCGEVIDCRNPDEVFYHESHPARVKEPVSQNGSNTASPVDRAADGSWRSRFFGKI